MIRGPKKSLTDLSAEYVRSIFNYDPVTGKVTWKITLSKRAVAGKPAGYLDDQGRIKVGINDRCYMMHRIIWLWMTGSWPKYEIDHKDEIKSNNKWKNLRAATPSENHRNRGPQKNNTSGYKGVTYVPKRKRWIAGIKLNGYRHNLGSFTSAEEAYAAYCKAAIRLHGKFRKV